MGRIEHLIDVYESWDYDSLVDEAVELTYPLENIVARLGIVRETPLYVVMMIGAYFMDADGSVDGAEDSLFRDIYKGQPINISGFRYMQSYRNQNWEPIIERILRLCSSSERETILRFGMVVCASDGFITDSERRRILRWA